MRTSAIALLAALLALPLNAQRERRMPPSAVGCDRDHLTSYTGAVARYVRKGPAITLTIKTDWDTTETVSLKAGDAILLNAEPMKERDWKRVELAPGKLRRGMRATVWVCEGGRPVLDWQPPPE